MNDSPFPDPSLRTPAPASDASGRLRVAFLLRVPEKDHEAFLAEYNKIRYHVASIDGHLVDQVCQSIDDQSQWMITSEWESPEAFLAWEASQGHRNVAGQLVGYADQRQSLRFVVRQETVHGQVV